MSNTPHEAQAGWWYGRGGCAGGAQGRRWLSPLLVAGLLVSTGTRFLPTGVAQATGVTVSSCDEGHLRSAITSAGAGGMVSFGCSGTITLAATVTISQDVTIDGSGQAVTLSGGHGVQVLVVNSGVRLTLNHLIIANGHGVGNGGGGIQNVGTLSVSNSTFSGNSAYGDDSASGIGGAINNWSGGTLIVSTSTFSGNVANRNGGAIFNYGTARVSSSTFIGGSSYAGGAISNYGALSVTNSTFRGNSASWGGAIDNNVGTLSVSNSTFSGNIASSYGGAINGGGALSVSSSTLSGNSAASGGAINIGGGLRMSNTIVANSPSGGNCFFFAANTGPDGGGNVDDGSTCGFSAANHSRSNTNPQLLPLGNNGGPTQTMALALTSPAIGAGVAATCLSTASSSPVNDLDQRGIPRHADTRGVCDSGAYDTGASGPPPALFSDGFESGNLSAWSTIQTNAGGSALVENYLVSSGHYAARLSATADPASVAYVRKTFGTALANLLVSGDFNVRAQGVQGSTVPIYRLFDAAGTLVVSLYRLNATNGQLWVQADGAYRRTTGMLALKTWGHLVLQVSEAGPGKSTVAVWLEGQLIYQNRGLTLGSDGVQTLQIGNQAPGQLFDLVADTIDVQS